ncbi:hypothetical protein AVEN_52033-1 [Araneus ventricosus]|uniref:Uncharacterized protein n=1 Tax=Araneus ventricosus TaxID=182803 RepID=A0A4Y2CG78_ARAVE|nr:hypothetical protein AVEN_52033-1 [Araneus ventricosus]
MYDLTCKRPTYTEDLQWNRVSNLQPSGFKTETLPLGLRCHNTFAEKYTRKSSPSTGWNVKCRSLMTILKPAPSQKVVLRLFLLNRLRRRKLLSVYYPKTGSETFAFTI